MTDLNPQQFLFHGTAQDIKGDRILPAKVHGGKSYWESTGDVRGEPANEHAWAHPDEGVAWDAAMDRLRVHYADGEQFAPRARVVAVHPNPEQSPGHDKSMEGEIKAPHFDIAHSVDIQPGHQGTFPEVNWNRHVGAKHPDSMPQRYLPGEEDANHPSDVSVKYGHNAGVHGWAWHSHGDGGSEYTMDPSRSVAHLQQEAKTHDDNHYLQRLDDRNIGPKYSLPDPTLPGMVNKEQFGPRRRGR